MRKFYYLCLLTLFTCWQLNAQVQVGTGTENTNALPIFSCYGYSYSQQIYLAYEINASGDITSLTFDVATLPFSGVDNSLDWVIYLGHTSKSSFNNNEDWVALADLTQVYSGQPYDVSLATGLLEITLDTPFSYDGNNNLIVAVEENTDDYNCSMRFNRSNLGDNRAIYYRNDFNNPDPANPPSATGRQNYVNNIIFGGIQQTCPIPTDLNATVQSSTSATISWTAGDMESSWDYVVQAAGTGTPTVEGTNVTSTSVNLDALTADTNYEFYVRAVCTPGSDNSAWVGPISFYTGYCIPSQSSTLELSFIDDFTTSGTISNINNTATGRPSVYSDYTAMSVTSFAGAEFNFNTVVQGGPVGCAIWIDFNNNLTFDSSELVFNSTSELSTPSGSINIPANTPNGSYRMRVMIDYSNNNPSNNPCALIRGEVEDYTVTIVDQPTDTADNALLSSLVITGSTDSVTSIETCQSMDVTVEVNEAGVTDLDAMAAGENILVWVAKSTENTDPSTWANDAWQPATYTQDVGSNDEFSSTFTNLTEGTYYFASRVQYNYGPFIYGVLGGIYDGSTNNNAELMVNLPATVTASASSSAICLGGEVTLTASSTDTTYTYEWDNDAGSGESVTVSPTSTTTYTVTATNEAGCEVTSSVTVTVNELPSEVTVSADNSSICLNSVSTLTTTGGTYNQTILSEDFNGETNNWTTVNNSTSGDVEAAAWTLIPDGAVISGTWHSNDNSQFYLTNSDAAGSGADIVTDLISPVFSTEGLTNTKMKFYHHYRKFGTDSGKVEISTDNGASWTQLALYNSTTGGTSNFIMQELDLSAYDNMPSLQVRFHYEANWDWYWAIDNVSLFAEVQEVVWTPATNLYTDEEATEPYVEGAVANMVYFKPAETGESTYTATAITNAGCTSSAEIAITVKPIPDTPEADTVQEFCPELTPTVADLMATGTNIMWYDAATGGNLLASTDALVEGQFYYAEQVNEEGCSSTLRAAVVVDFDNSLCPEENDDCGDAQMLTIAANAVVGSSSNASLDAMNACDATAEGVWYTVVGDGANLSVIVVPTNWDAQVSVLEGSCSAFNCVGSSNTEGVGGTEVYTFPSNSGETYYIFVSGGVADSEGDFAIRVTSNLDIEDIDGTNNSLTLYPNPVVDILSIKSDKEVKVAQVFDQNGRMIKEVAKISENTINVQNLQTGSYIIRVFLEDNSVVTEKFIKK